MNELTKAKGDVSQFSNLTLGDVSPFPEDSILSELNSLPLSEAIKQMQTGLHTTTVFSTFVRNRLEPILSIEFEKVNKNEIIGVVIDTGKAMMQEKLTPKFLKDDKADTSIVQTIDAKFAKAGMPLNLHGIFSMPDQERRFMLDFIRFWGSYKG